MFTLGLRRVYCNSQECLAARKVVSVVTSQHKGKLAFLVPGFFESSALAARDELQDSPQLFND